MRFLITIALIATVASAAITKPSLTLEESGLIQEVIAAINSPSTDPATAAALEQLLFDLMGIGNPEPVVVGPAVVDSFEPIIVGPAIIEPNPIAIGPEIIDFPLPDGGEITAPVEPSPVVVGPTPAESSPLVQIIVNVNKPAPSPVVIPEPVQIVDQAPIVPEPVIIVDQAPIVPEPVIVVDQAPIAPEPVIIGTPIIPSPAVVLPDTLN